MPVSKRPQKRQHKRRQEKISNAGLEAGSAGAMLARDMRVWVSALDDMETYAILNGWKWAGIGGREVTRENNLQ